MKGRPTATTSDQVAAQDDPIPAGLATASPTCDDDAQGGGDRPLASIPQGQTAADEASTLSALEAELGQADAADEEACASPRSDDSQCQCVLPQGLEELIDQRIRIWSELLSLDERRQKVCGNIPVREIRDELARQERELQRAPAADILVRSMQQITKRLANPVLPSLANSDTAAAQNGEPKPGEPKPEDIYRKVLEAGLTQCKLLGLRTRLDAKVPATAAPAMENEPMPAMCRKVGIDADTLVGWTYYCMGLFRRMGECRRREDEYNKQLAAARSEAESGGLMSKLKNACLGAQQELAALDPAVRRTRQAIERELRAIEPMLSELFWKLYADVAWAYAGGSLGETEQVTARAMLRYGMLAVHPSLIAPQLRDYIIEDCTKDVYTWANTPEALHVVYADEYIKAIHQRLLTVSPDEDLELNNRGSDEWKADRVWRQTAIYSAKASIYEARMQELAARASELDELCETQKNALSSKRGRSDPKVAQLAQELAVNRADLARLRQAVERFETKLVPELKERAEEANKRLEEALAVLSPEMVVRREALFVRRLARLAARLKEPFVPFVLRDTLVPGRSDHFSRTSVLEMVKKLEECDNSIFHEVLINNKRPDRRVTVRLSPALLIIPGRGQMGLSLCPRKWDDCGRMIIPLGFQRQNGLEALLTDMFSDFRWDCSKEDAGAEWITADALCSAYAAVRWNYRRFSEQAQKTMGIDRKQKDRENWRVHYRLFISSAADGGRYLFNKCFDVYKNVVLRHVGLPPGVQPLRRD